MFGADKQFNDALRGDLQRIRRQFTFINRGNGFTVEIKNAFAICRQGGANVHNTQQIFFPRLNDEQRRGNDKIGASAAIGIRHPRLN